MVGAAGLEPATLCLEVRSGHALEVACFQALMIQRVAAARLKRVELDCSWVLLTATKSSTASFGHPPSAAIHLFTQRPRSRSESRMSLRERRVAMDNNASTPNITAHGDLSERNIPSYDPDLKGSATMIPTYSRRPRG